MKPNVTLVYGKKSFSDMGFTDKNDTSLWAKYSVNVFNFNQTYYMEFEGKLTAFRVLAISLIKKEYLIQFPSFTRVMKTHEIPSNIYLSKDDYFAHIEGAKKNIELEYISFKVNDLHPSFSKGCPVYFYYSYKWDELLVKPTRHACLIHYIILTKDGIYISYSNKNETFPTYEDCVKHHLEGMIVEDFASNDIPYIKIETNNQEKPIIHTLKFVES
jgi:hypothetical protein